jgi:hypothetical protein
MTVLFHPIMKRKNQHLAVMIRCSVFQKITKDWRSMMQFRVEIPNELQTGLRMGHSQTTRPEALSSPRTTQPASRIQKRKNPPTLTRKLWPVARKMRRD